MLLKRLTLTNFKNIPAADLEFSPKVNAFVGNNGMGKSNLLDAIYTLSLTKSFASVPDKMLITRGQEFTLLSGHYMRRDVEEHLGLGIAQNRRKSLKRSGKEYQRISDHIGQFPLVLAATHDIDLLRGSAEERRRWMDMIICQGDPRYLDALMRYNHALEQRNRLLRELSANSTLYDVVEMQLDAAAAYITGVRAGWVERLQEMFLRHYGSIAATDEPVELLYEPSVPVGESLTRALDAARAHDTAVRHTSVGPHRDDLAMLLDQTPARRTASQGQGKTFVLALRLAQYEFLSRATSLRPLLLLDDIFDRLDANRVERLIQTVTSKGFGQIFITDTNRTHLDQIISRSAGDYRLWHVEGGTFTPRQ